MLTLKVKVVRPEQIRLLIIWGFRGRAPRREGSTQRSAGAGGDFPLLKKKMKMEENKSEIVIFKTSDDKVSIDVHFEGETVWLTIDDMASLFEKSRSTINEHILNIFEEGELEKENVVRKIGNSDFSTKIIR